MKKISLSQEQMAWLHANFSTLPNTYICEYLNVKRTWLCELASSIGLRKSKEYLSRLRRESWISSYESRSGKKWTKEFKEPRPLHRFIKGKSFSDMFGEERAKQIRRNNIDAIRQSRLKDLRRYILCLPQRTNIHYGRHSSMVYCFRYKMRKLGYIVRRFENDIYYNDNTERDQCMETKGRSFGIRFYRVLADQ